MRLAKFLWAFFLLMPIFFFNFNIYAAAEESDDYVPEVTARVARISFLRGDVQIKRAAESDQWERATLNLPLVEGDRIATGADARVEIQFDRDTFLRLAENSYLKVTTLRDEGVALSLPQGTLSLRVYSFDKDRQYFEIDAPQTTISVLKTGMYRVDAGEKDSEEVRVTATDGGEARVYADNSGFTVRNGRSARIYISGSYTGEHEMADASRYADEWDSWVLERDTKIARKLREAYYDKYYDRDIYGAEDLNEHGEWVYTRKYGWVWKPYRNSIAGYVNWSPYRYGHWRWVPPYGWTWINDEPWGWATYHHGRWVFYNGDWYWTPYAYHRPRRSWWYPALVVVTWSGNLICWYPLPYNYGYYNYNSYYYSKRRVTYKTYNTTIINNNTTVVVNPTPTPSPGPTPNGTPVPFPGKSPKLPPFQTVPPGGVVTVSKEQFAAKVAASQNTPLNIAKQVLAQAPPAEGPPILPDRNDRQIMVNSDVFIEKPRQAQIEPAVKTGVLDRRTGVSMDQEIQQRKVFEDRRPVERQRDSTSEKTVRGRIDGSGTEIRDTGAVERPSRPIVRPNNGGDSNTEPRQTPPIRMPAPSNTDRRSDDGPPVRQTPPVRDENQTMKPRRDENPPPVYVPPRSRDEQRTNRQPPPPPPPTTRREEQPRNDSPRQPREEPRREQPRQETPRRDESKPEPRPQPPTDSKTSKDARDS